MDILRSMSSGKWHRALVRVKPLAAVPTPGVVSIMSFGSPISYFQFSGCCLFYEPLLSCRPDCAVVRCLFPSLKDAIAYPISFLQPSASSWSAFFHSSDDSIVIYYSVFWLSCFTPALHWQCISHTVIPASKALIQQLAIRRCFLFGALFPFHCVVTRMPMPCHQPMAIIACELYPSTTPRTLSHEKEVSLIPHHAHRTSSIARLVCF